MKPIAYIKTDFKEKFGIPRQSGLINECKGKIVFLKEYSVPEAFRGLENFSHIWVLWEFSEAKRESRSPTVRPPLLGGNKRMGVFATRSPFRPNNIGLSAVRLDKVDLENKDGVTLYVSGADMLDGTPVFDVKPYLPYADSIPGATGGFTENLAERSVDVVFPEALLSKVPEEKRASLSAVLKGDPRPSYQADPERIYGMKYGGFEVKFKVDGGVLEVKDILIMNR
ncbi:MAG: tRNA (N6-threonylcarbamoyladenosine(37)-N6)-methyltransferase TrmO [Acutalibacteraceae bacterium]